MRRIGFFILSLMFPVLCHAAWASINIDTRTIAAMTAQTSGLPLRLPAGADNNGFGEGTTILSGATRPYKRTRRVNLDIANKVFALEDVRVVRRHNQVVNLRAHATAL